MVRLQTEIIFVSYKVDTNSKIPSKLLPVLAATTYIINITITLNFIGYSKRMQSD